MSCSVCGISPGERAAVILWTHTLKGRRRTVEYVICNLCDLKERRAK